MKFKVRTILFVLDCFSMTHVRVENAVVCEVIFLYSWAFFLFTADLQFFKQSFCRNFKNYFWLLLCVTFLDLCYLSSWILCTLQDRIIVRIIYSLAFRLQLYRSGVPLSLEILWYFRGVQYRRHLGLCKWVTSVYLLLVAILRL